ncbi:MAG: diaminopimelate decarboxylase [Candidatus Hydrothermarchaeaceae archaeon]
MSELRPHIKANEKHHLTIGGVDAVALADEFGTPLYVTDENRVRERYREFRDAFSSLYPKVEVRYAYKANTGLAVLHILKQEGAGADIVSAGELYIALKVGLKPEQIIFTGNNKSDNELEMALNAGVTINIDAVHELERLRRTCEEVKKSARISFRINPAVSPGTHPHLSTGLRESKFGIPAEEALDAYKLALDSAYLKISGLHMHIGSQITSTSPYEEATEKLLEIAGKLKEIGIELDFVDVGGGLGIRYEEKQSFVTPKQLAEALTPLIKSKIKEYGLKELELYLEPGRYIVGDASITLARVSTIKKTPYRKFIGVDAGFHVLSRPLLYDGYHEVVVANKINEKNIEKVHIAGNLCESGDILAKDRTLPNAEKDDILAFMDTGAYCMVMSSQYNSRPRPAEVLVKDDEYELIRERENFEDIFEKQRIPERLLK